MPRRRLGVALVLSGRAGVEIDGLRAALGDPSAERIPPHLTLVPPVNVRVEDVDKALAVLRGAAAATMPFELELGPPATFLPDNPVVYLRAGAGADDVHRLRTRVFVPPLERRLTWPFVPHVTLADSIEPWRVEQAVAVLGGYTRTVAIEAVDLLEESEGRRWSSIARFDLSGRAVVGRGGAELELTTGETVDDEARRWLGERWPSPQRPLAVTARRDASLVGVAAGWTDGDLANLSELFVEPSARGEGAGSHLLARFLSTAAERGASFCRLRTRGGSGADRFYRDRGWREEARYAGAAPDQPIVQLVRHLGAGD